MIAAGQRRGRFDGVDAHDGAAQPLLVGSHACRQVGHRRFVTQFAAQRFAGGIELAALASNAARPRILSERVDHRAAHPPFGEGLELDAASFIEPVRGVDQAEDAVLNQVADVDGVRHRSRHAASQRFDKRQAGDDSAVLGGGSGLNAHLVLVSWKSEVHCHFRLLTTIATAVPTAEPVRQIGADCAGVTPVSRLSVKSLQLMCRNGSRLRSAALICEIRQNDGASRSRSVNYLTTTR